MTRFNFKGWDIKKWVKYNKDNLRNLIVLVAGYNYLSGFSWESFLVAVGVVIGKLLVDSFDYFVSE